MSYARDPRVDDYLYTLPEWQRKVAQTVRDIVHSIDPAVKETVKRTNRPYFECNGNVCALLGTKDHLNIFLYDPIAPDPEGLINQGQHNLTARTIQIYEHDTLNEVALANLLRAIIANNYRGGWRTLLKR